MFFTLVRAVATMAVAFVAYSAEATGMLPDSPLLIISEADGTAQMGLKNTEDEPLLLYTTIVDVPEDNNLSVFAVPPVARVEAKGRQMVRFLLEKPPEELKVQHLKRVRFEGIPAVNKDNSVSGVKISIRQDIPVIISPRGLVQDPAPWKKILWKLSNLQLTISNPSPFVARLSQEVELLPSGKQARLLPSSYILPNQSFTVALPAGIDAAAITGIRIFPASPYGFSVDPFEVTISR